MTLRRAPAREGGRTNRSSLKFNRITYSLSAGRTNAAASARNPPVSFAGIQRFASKIRAPRARARFPRVHDILMKTSETVRRILYNSSEKFLSHRGFIYLATIVRATMYPRALFLAHNKIHCFTWTRNISLYAIVMRTLSMCGSNYLRLRFTGATIL